MSAPVFDVLLGVPSDCSGRFAGCQLMPAALRAAGVVDAVGVEDSGICRWRSPTLAATPRSGSSASRTCSTSHGCTFAPETTIVTFDELVADPEGHARRAVARLDANEDAFWLHLDLDVLSSDVMPAVDYPDPRGLDFAQLCDVLTVAFASPNLDGASVVILNPTRAPADDDSARRVVEVLAASIGR